MKDAKQGKNNQPKDNSTACDLTSSGASNPTRRRKESHRIGFDEQIFQNRSKMYNTSSCEPKIYMPANDRSNNNKQTILFKEFILPKYTDAFFPV